MHLLTAFSLKNRALIALVTIVAAVFGLIGVSSLKQELMPSVQYPAIAIVTSYPGASPEVVNKDVSGPIETALKGVPQLESTNATSTTGSSMVVAQFTYGIDLPSTEQKVERAISRISKQLPAAADSQVLSGSIDDFPVIQIAVTPGSGQTSEQTAALITRLVTPKLSDLDGVRDAQLSGAPVNRITITPDSKKLADQGLTTQSITDALQQSGVLVAAGTVDDGDQTLAVQAGSEITSAKAIADLPIPRSAASIAAEQQAAAQAQQQAQAADAARQAQAEGGDPAQQAQLQAQAEQQAQAPSAPRSTAVAKIGEVAKVVEGPGPVTSISRVNGAEALSIAVTKMSAANTVDVSHAVQQKLDELQDQLDGAKLTVIFDQAPYVEQSIETLAVEGMLGLLFAVLVILVFLMSVRATLVTAISIPTSVLLTFVGLNFAEYSLNMLTLGALTISIGRVVDDSIVVIENIKRHLADGPDRAATIITAVREVAGAITASTVTTVAVFLPMAFVDGMVGEMFRPFAFTVTIALAASLLVSLTIVPVLAYWFLRPEATAKRSRRGKRAASAGASEGAIEAPKTSEISEAPEAPEATHGAHAADARTSSTEPVRLNALQRGYRPVITWTLKRPAITLIIAIAVFVGTMAATPLMKTNYMGEDGQNEIGLVQTLAPGTSLDAQLAQVKRVEDALKGMKDIETVQVTIGSAGTGMAAIFGGGGDGTINYSLSTSPDADQAVLQDKIRKAAAQLDDAGDFAIAQSGGGMTASSEIQVNVTAPDQETLAKASDVVLAKLKDAEGLKQVQSDLAQSRPYLAIEVDREAAAKAGLSEAALAGQVAQAMQPTQIGQITIDADNVAVYLASDAPPTDLAGVKALKVQTATGEQSLSALAKVEVADGPVSITTEDGARTVTVSALPQGDDLTTASASVATALDQAKLPAGATAKAGGVMSQQADAFRQLGIALLAAVLIVYVVMVATFRSLLQPLLLLISVPFAATGALLLLIATGIPLGVASLIGVLMLVGIVVTNAIVLIDLVNQYRRRGDGLYDAVVHGSLQRLRPIVMTALATILALTPMGLGITGHGGFISQPLAVVVIGGLLSSTVLTLVVLPTLYYAVERARERSAEKRARKREGRVAGAAAVGAGALAAAGSGIGGGAPAGEPSQDAEPGERPAAEAGSSADDLAASPGGVSERHQDQDRAPEVTPAELASATPLASAAGDPDPDQVSGAEQARDREDNGASAEHASPSERGGAPGAAAGRDADDEAGAEVDAPVASDSDRDPDSDSDSDLDSASNGGADSGTDSAIVTGPPTMENLLVGGEEVADATTRLAILDELMRAGLAAPEVAERASRRNRPEAAEGHAETETEAEVWAESESESTEEAEDPATEVPAAEASEAASPEADGESHATEGAASIEAILREAEAADEPEAADDPAPEAAPGPGALSDEDLVADEEPEDTRNEDAPHPDRAGPLGAAGASAAPGDGLLSWEQLLWQATQETDEEPGSKRSASDEEE
ncbi:efflux RND transporter permease subunit [Leucobacter sp. CSA2]|uniref:Efflux RND transporter permease subunit n=1 Tax=Leucobacter edaphi TaxID=2796472 RepID=A0A934QAJ1_9MICO|nr:efflux RND transporter permease subunit [Leucobacter edaphi]MBK0420553.1 efflux RND transporter permease subunit [Leucobacter edaphi]